jgi:hypothetical protein
MHNGEVVHLPDPIAHSLFYACTTRNNAVSRFRYLTTSSIFMFEK